MRYTFLRALCSLDCTVKSCARGLAAGIVITFVVVVPVLNYMKPVMFYEYLSDGEKAQLLSTLDLFKHLMGKGEVPYFIGAGTLLGSYRHHGFIPWDDDIDVFMPLTQKYKAAQLLNQLKPSYILDDSQIRWKLYLSRGQEIWKWGVTWKFPFLDITFYVRNKTHIWDEDTTFVRSVFAVKDVFPLSERPFEGRMLKAPRDPLAVIQQDYDELSTCRTQKYNHRTEAFRWLRWSIACSEIADRFPFVRRKPGKHGGCNETLVLNGSIISWILLENEEC